MSPRVRKPSAERREEIVRAALQIIGRRGLSSLTTAALAEAVGVTSGALFRHFASLEEILREVARWAVERIEETFPDPALPPLERLLGLARNRVRLLSTDPGLAWLLRSEQADRALPAEAVARLRELVRRSQRYLTDALREGAAQGSVRDDIEPELLLVPVMGTIHALVGMPGVHRAARRARRPTPERVLAALERLLMPPRHSRRR